MEDANQRLDNHIKGLYLGRGGSLLCSDELSEGPILAQKASPATWLLKSALKYC